MRNGWILQRHLRRIHDKTPNARVNSHAEEKTKGWTYNPIMKRKKAHGVKGNPPKSKPAFPVILFGREILFDRAKMRVAYWGEKWNFKSFVQEKQKSVENRQNSRRGEGLVPPWHPLAGSTRFEHLEIMNNGPSKKSEMLPQFASQRFWPSARDTIES